MTDDTNDDTDPKWTRPAILRRVPREWNLTDRQKDALVACVRNPDAGMDSLAEFADVNSTSVANLLKSMQRGIVGQKFHEGDYDGRLNRGTADFKDETVKRRAIIDYAARHPGVFDELPYDDIAERIEADLGVSVHGTYAHNVARNQATHLVHKRRDWYERHGRADEIVPVSEMDLSDDAGGDKDDRTVREKLEDAGVTTLPDENLDGLPTVEEAKRQGRRMGGRVIEADEVTVDRGEADEAATADADTATEHDGEPGTMTSQPASGSGTDESTDVPKSADSQPATTEREVGKARYEGPATGLDLTSSRPAKVLVGPEDADSGDMTDELERIRRECGPFGQKAAERDLEINHRDDLEHEIKVLRILVAQQGEYIDQLRRALDNMFVNVEAGFTIPAEESEE